MIYSWVPYVLSPELLFYVSDVTRRRNARAQSVSYDTTLLRRLSDEKYEK